MKFIYKIITVFIIVGSFVSCSDFIELESSELYEIDASRYLNTEEDYYQALYGAYDPLQWLYAGVLIGDIASDNSLAGGETAVDVIGLQEIDDMIHHPSNDQLTDYMRFCYEGVNRANYLTENYDKLDFDGKDELYGEVYFLRGYYYFELAKFFGRVAVFTSRLDASSSGQLPQNSIEEVYAQVESDLNLAISSLPSSQAQIGRATLGAAQALLGKAYLYQGKYDEAATMLENVIGQYTLVDYYGSQFLSTGENGTESVFEIQYTNQSDWRDWDFLPEGTEGNFGVIHNGPRGFAADGYASGWSFNVPTQDLYDAFEDGDTRKDATILDPVAMGEEYTPGNEDTGYFNHKYAPRAGESGAQIELNYGNNYRAIRYADVLLMAAEAHNLKSAPNDVLAQSYLNEVRQRAFGDEDHDISLTGDDLTEAIWEERRLELAMEGHRFFDLVRTNQAEDKIEGYESHNKYFPIPQFEIDLSGWTQVEGGY